MVASGGRGLRVHCTAAAGRGIMMGVSAGAFAAAAEAQPLIDVNSAHITRLAGNVANSNAGLTMPHRQDFIEEQALLRRAGQTRYDAIVGEKQTLTAVLNEECPDFQRFLHSAETSGDLDAAAQFLPAVIEAGCVEQTAEHLTASKLDEGVTVWRLRTRGFGVAGVSGCGDFAKAGESWNTVTLRIKVEPEKRRIDSEFFGWNEEVDGIRNTTDDIEKFHIVWEWNVKADNLALVYAGFGANQPYELEHPHAQRFRHRPRFRVFDREESQRYQYRVDWQDCGAFDWNWQYAPFETTASGTTLTFVSLLDGTYLCLSDREVAEAGADKEHWDACREAMESIGALQEFRYWKATVSLPTPEHVEASDQDPNLMGFVCAPGRDYVAYFAALNASQVKIACASDVKKATAPLGSARASQYEQRIARRCDEVYRAEFVKQLPSTMGELFATNLTSMVPELARAVEDWKAKILDEIRRDLYHYGQDAMARMNRLRFAAWIAMDERFGAIYFAARSIALNRLKGMECHGHLLAKLK